MIAQLASQFCSVHAERTYTYFTYPQHKIKIRSCLGRVVRQNKGLVSVTRDKLHVRNDEMPQKKRKKR